MKPLVDILLATYNGEKYLQEQIDSILSQSYQNFHLIIRDDGSTDRTMEIVHEIKKRHPSQITLLNDQSHQGIIGSFSSLLSSSEAPYVMFADQDDVWLKHKVEATLHKMLELEENDKPILVHSDLKVVNDKLQEISPSFWSYTRLKPREGAHLNRLLVQNEVTGCTIMMNRHLIDLAMPIFPESVMHDWWLAIVAAAFGHIGIVSEPLILYRQHGKNTLGAKKFGLSISKNLPITQQKKHAQASELLKRFQWELPSEKARMITDYVSMKDSPILRNKYLTLKHRFWKQGLIKKSLLFSIDAPSLTIFMYPKNI